MSYDPSKRFHLIWLSQKQACHAWLFLVKKRAIFGLFLPFLGVANEQKGPNTCFSIYVDVIWPIKAFPFGLVESGASLPCLAFFGQKRSIFGQTQPRLVDPKVKKRFITRSHICDLLVEPQNLPFGT